VTVFEIAAGWLVALAVLLIARAITDDAALRPAAADPSDRSGASARGRRRIDRGRATAATLRAGRAGGNG
jgi:hypothetical protein